MKKVFSSQETKRIQIILLCCLIIEANTFGPSIIGGIILVCLSIVHAYHQLNEGIRGYIEDKEAEKQGVVFFYDAQYTVLN